MTTVLQDPAVRAYLDELRRLLGSAPDRDLVVDGVARHIEDASSGDPARVREVLDELGDPAAIAAESAAPPSAEPRAPFLDRRGGGVLTVVLLALGGLVVPVLGWVAGLVCLWLSRGWTTADKLVGTLLAPVGGLLVAGIAGYWLAVAPVHLLLLAGPVTLGLVAAVLLLLRFRPAT